MNDLESSILLTMAPILVLMVGMIVYGVIKSRNKDRSTQSKREADALIEAKALLAKYQKENSENESKTKDSPQDNGNEKTEENSPTNQEEGLENDKTSQDNSAKQDDPKQDEKTNEQEKTKDKPQKPSADAPIQDTTELEPDIDKVEE